MYFNRHIEAWLTVKFPVLGGCESVKMKQRQIVSESFIITDDFTDNNNELSQNDIDIDDNSEFLLLSLSLSLSLLRRL